MQREISIILKVKGAQAAKKAVQDIFNNQTNQLVSKFNKGTKKAGDNVERVGRKSKAARTKVMTFTKALGRGMAAIYLYQRAWATFGAQFEEGAKLERASHIFQQNVGDVQKMMPILRKSVKGMVSDFNLLKTANRAVQQGLSGEKLAKSFRMGAIAAQKLGLDGTEAIKTVTNAITRQDEGALTTLGIITKVNQQYKVQEALIAKSGGVMSKAMSIRLRQNLIMRELEQRFGANNKLQDDSLLVLERLRASWDNFRAALGKTIGIGLKPLMKALTGVLDVTSRFLNKVEKKEGFQNFIKSFTTFAVMAGTVKAGSGLLSIVGALTSLGSAKTLTGVSKAGRMGRSLKVLTDSLAGKAARKSTSWLGAMFNTKGGLYKGLTKVMRLGLKFFRRIPMWGKVLTAFTLLWKPLTSAINKVTPYFQKMGTAVSAYFQLLENYDEKSGMSKVLTKDKEALGGAFEVVRKLVQWTVKLGDALERVGNYWDMFDEAAKAMSTGASPLAIASKILTASNLKGNKTAQQDMRYVANNAPNIHTPEGAKEFFIPQTSDPTIDRIRGIEPRDQNLQGTESPELQELKKVTKLTQKQLEMQEKEISKNEVRESQKSAAGNSYNPNRFGLDY